MLEFCKHEKLCYEWPAFLPKRINNWDSFWAGLNAEIKEQLAETEILKSRKFKRLRRVQDVRMIGVGADLNDTPLFDDEQRDPFISPLYNLSNIFTLIEYGLRFMNESELLDLIKLDVNSTTSRMHGSSTDSTEAWHTAVAKLLCSWFKDGKSAAYNLRSLPLLPMKDGSWRRADSSPAYFPTTEGLSVPEHLGLELLNPTACANADRRALFRHLGISEAEVQTVRTSILAAFRTQESPGTINMRARLHFLYLTHPSGRQLVAPEGIWIYIPGLQGHLLGANDIYLRESVDPYSANALLSATECAPGLPTKFVHSQLMTDVPQPPNPNHPTWERWLYDYLGVRERIRLLSRDGKSLSEAFEYVLNHRPESFLGLFEILWRHERQAITPNKKLQTQISNLGAANLCNVKYKISLKNTWLPLENLKEMINRYTENTEIFPLDSFPFLKIDAKQMIGQADSKWKFLRLYFSVNYTDNLTFLLAILDSIQSACISKPSVRLSERIFDLYVAIATKHAVEKDSASATKQLKYVC